MDLQLVLSYFDNIHDFGELCTYGKNSICNYLYNYYKPKIEPILKKIELMSESKMELMSEFKNSGFTSFNNKKDHFIAVLINLINNNNDIKKIDIKQMQSKIVNNFQILFENINDIETILNILQYVDNNDDYIEISKYCLTNRVITPEFWEFNYIRNLIFYQRQQIYYLIYYQKIKKYDKVNELVDYFTSNTVIQEKVKENLKNHIIKLNRHNITFPITMFDDTNKDTLYFKYINGLFKFKILNENKKNIDAAKISTGDKFFNSLKKNNTDNTINSYQFMFIKKGDKIGLTFFDINNNLTENKILIDNFTFQLNKSVITHELFIECKYNLDNDIHFNVLQNNVGRGKNSDDEDDGPHGLFQVAKLLIKYIEENKNILKFDELKINIETHLDYESTKTTIDKIITKIYNHSLLDVIELDKSLLQLIIRDETLINNILLDRTLLDEKILEEILLEKAKQLIVCLLFGAKRFGDWLQMELSYDNYFYLQTHDLLCKIYGILIGAPILWIDSNYNITAYNYDITSSNIINYDYSEINKEKNLYKIDSEDNTIQLINRKYKDNMSDSIKLYTNRKTIPTSEKLTAFNRIYYNKYKKYKIKYLELKKNIK